jgi:alpha-glucoside transport system substrate-binding protein
MFMKKLGTIIVAVAVAASVVVLPTANAADEVTIFGAFSGDQQKGFEAELNAFGAANGIKISYTALASYDTDIRVKVKAGQAPNIGIWPQPGGLLEYSAVLEPIDTLKSVDLAGIKKTLVPGWSNLAVKGGKTYGLPVSANVKSLVWYNPANFKAAGLKVPKTDAAMTKLTNTIKSKKLGFPWCIGIESGGATGWAATDWMEEYVLRYGGEAQYTAWWKGKLPWSSPTVQKAAAKFASVALTPGNVNGGGKAIAATSFGETSKLFATDKSKCFMLRQGSFITGLFPDAVKAEYQANNFSRVGVFKLPAPAGTTDAVLGGGDLAGAFDANPATQKVMNFILSDKLGQGEMFATYPAYLSAHKTFPSAGYKNPITKRIAVLLSTSKLFGFDGSDLAPAVVNATQWTELTNWMAGKKTLKQAFAAIDASWSKA